MWTTPQVRTVQKYRRWARVPDAEYRSFLRSVSGVDSSIDPILDNRHFDLTMRWLEERTQEAVANSTANKLPDRIDLGYWRRKPARKDNNPGALQEKVWTMWQLLCTMIPEEKRNDAYLNGLAGQALRGKVLDWRNLQGWDMIRLVEALKKRVDQGEPKNPRIDPESPDDDIPF